MDKFEEAPTKKIVFPDGKVRSLNRRERRQMKLYGKNLRPLTPEEMSKVKSQKKTNEG